MFFQKMMGFDKNERSGCLKTYAALNADNGISHMDVPADPIGLRKGLQMLNSPYRAGKFFSIHRAKLSFFKLQFKIPDSRFGYLRRPCFLWQVLPGAQCFFSSNRSSP